MQTQRQWLCIGRRRSNFKFTMLLIHLFALQSSTLSADFVGYAGINNMNAKVVSVVKLFVVTIGCNVTTFAMVLREHVSLQEEYPDL